jgi:Holliday junction resolvase
VRDALTEDGYAVSRTAGSKTKVDLFALKPGQLLLVQCKKNGKCPPAERKRLLELSSWVYEAIPVVAYRPDPRRIAIGYRRLVGPGPKEWLPFPIDELSSAS